MGGSTFTVQGLASETEAGPVVLTGASAGDFTAALQQSCNPTTTTLTLTVANALTKAKATGIELKFTLKSVGYGRQGQAITISSEDLVTDHTNKYSVSPTEFPADEWKYVLATSTGDVEQISPARVVPGKKSVTLKGLKGGEQAGLTSGTCGDIALGSGASSAKTQGKSLTVGTSLDFSAENLATGTYKTCIIRTSDGCGKSGDFNTAGVSGASLTVVSPTIDAGTKLE